MIETDLLQSLFFTSSFRASAVSAGSSGPWKAGHPEKLRSVLSDALGFSEQVFKNTFIRLSDCCFAVYSNTVLIGAGTCPQP